MSRYTKVCNNGKLAGEGSCPVDPVLGSASNDWACTKDNKTGLVWEVKTESGLHDMYNRYTWYDPWYSLSLLNNGKKNGGSCIGSQCDTYAYTNAVNKEKFCGAKDWRVPTIGELQSIVKNSGAEPSIDATFFPNTYSFFWSSTTYPGQKSNAWGTYFYTEGYSNFSAKSGSAAVRLVRGQAKSAGRDPSSDEKPAFGLVLDDDLKWAKGQQIRVRFVNGSFDNQKIVFDKLKEWETVAKVNLKIVWVTKNKFGGKAVADVRIRIPGTDNPDTTGTHSFVGTGSQINGFSPEGLAVNESQIAQPCDLKLYGNDCFVVNRMMISDYPSISYQYMNTGDILHEFGHALGFQHEHISPAVDIPWVDNTKIVTDYYKLYQGWDEEKTMLNVFGMNKDANGKYVKPEICKTCYSPYDSTSIRIKS